MTGLVIGMWVLGGLALAFVVLTFFGGIFAETDRMKSDRYLAGKLEQDRREGRA